MKRRFGFKLIELLMGIGLVLFLLMFLSLFSWRNPSPISPISYSSNNLKNIALAARYYESEHQSFPSGALLDSDGRLLHGWPSQLLPMLDAAALHRQIDFELPWNHELNQESMAIELRVFLNPKFERKTPEGYGAIHYAGNSHVLFPGSQTRFEDVTDGMSNTLFFGEVATQFQAWGSPYNFRDPVEGLNTSPDGFGSPWKEYTHFAFGDGSVRPVSDDIDPHVLRALSTPRGGEEIPEDY